MKLPRKRVYIPIIFIIFLFFFFKPITVYILEAYVSKGLKAPVEFTSMQFFPFKFKGIIHVKTFPEGIKVDGKYRDKMIVMTSRSFGGLVTVIYKHLLYTGSLKNIDAVKFSEFLGNKKYIQSGYIDGTFRYSKRSRSGETDLKARDIVLYGLDLDKKLSTINEALQFDFQKLMERAFHEKDKNTTAVTHIDHLQFNTKIYYKDVLSTDIALRTQNYRLAIDGNVSKKGPINYFKVSMVDENGCAVISQTLQGDIRKPKVKKTSTEVVHIASQTTPSSILGMGLQMINYSKNFGPTQGIMKNANMQITEDMILQADHFIQDTSKIVMPNDCNIVYVGRVEHPKKN